MWVKYTPKNLGRIKFRRIRWKIEEVQSSFLPNFPQFFHFPISMNRSIVQDNYSLLRNIERESIKIVHNLVCVDGLFCGKAFILVPFGNHAKDIKPGSFLGWDVNILILELPAIWNISVCTDMAFVGII